MIAQNPTTTCPPTTYSFLVKEDPTDGHDVEGRLGNEVMYQLIDGRVMFVPPSVRDQITHLGIKTGEPFNICKRETNDHGESMVEWLVGRNGDQPSPKAVENVRHRLEAAGL